VNVVEWLRGLGLEQYAPTFHDNDIDGEVLPELTADDLTGLGVNSIGHRRKLLGAIAALRGGAPQPITETASTGSPLPNPPPLVGEGRVGAEAERRQLTVMFCDLVGSTPLSTRFDPEDLREVIGAYHRCVADTVARFVGFVAKYMGDGVLIYFGYPEAHEDDAERAIRAGLAVIAAVGELATPEPLNVRLGIASGLVVVGDLIGEGAAQERGVVGETPNLAARLQALATPGTLVIAESTRRQIGALFDLEDLGPQPLAGFAGPQRAWRVIGESGVVSRFEALRSEATPLVGRDEERDLLLRRWQQAKAGEGRVVLISGEPGIGKSRLTAALSQAIESELHTRLRYFCSPYHQDSALHPFIAQLERAAGFARDDTVEEKLGKLRALLAPAAPGDDEIALVAELLSLPSSVADLNLSPQRKREKLFEALLHQLAALARSRPILIVFEDAHWIDPTTRELLDLMLDRVSRLPVLIVVTFRPEFQHAWSGQPHVTMLTLNRLGSRDGATLVEQLSGNAGLPREIVDEIVERTDGVPLFVEELTKVVLESGDRDTRVAAVLTASPLPNLSIPATLHASLIARLDRLGPVAKEVGQIGAVIGREFGYELIEHVAQRPAAELQAGLDRLAEAGLLFCRGVAPQSSYLFKHALVQDAAYSTLLRAARQRLHRRIGEVLEEQFPAIAETQPELLAHHFTEAGLSAKAITYWRLGGRRSAARSAVVEGVEQLRRGLRLVSDLPDGHERAQRELELQVELGSTLQKATGYARPEVIDAWERARELIAITEAHQTPLGFSVLWGLCIANYSGGNVRSALLQAKEYLSTARSQAEAGPLAIGHRLVGTTLILSGVFPAALSHLEHAVSLCTAEAHRTLASRFGQDTSVTALCHYSWALWHRGYPEQARKASDDALQYAEHTGDAYTLSYALYGSIYTAAFERHTAEVERFANEQATLTSAHGFGWSTFAVFQGWAMAQRGNGAAGVERIREGLTVCRGKGQRQWETFNLGLLAEAHALAGDIEAGLAAVAQGLAAGEDTGEKMADAELYRLRGDLLRRFPQPDLSGAEASLRQAGAVARQQGTRGFELRAATSLAQLWGEQGRRAEARDLLAPVYGWFTEGFDTPDLKEAKALLQELDA
jgi:class 3 adenylate cyclase/predicted ATPase